MRAYCLESFGFDGLVLRDLPTPEPGPGEVLIEVKAASVNYRDYLMVKGLYDKNMPLPITPLSDGAGSVIGIGDVVSKVKVGDSVAGAFMPGWIEGEYTRDKGRTALGGPGPGMMATHVVLPESAVVQMPDKYHFEWAATLPCAGVTAWNALFGDVPIMAGDTVLVQGTGGVSMFALQFASAAGARVIVTSSSDEKLEKASRLYGAWKTINYKSSPDWGAAARKLTGGGVDKVIEVGGAGTLKQSIDAVKFGGSIEIVGVLSGAVTEMNIPMVLYKAVRFRGIYVGSVAMFKAMNRMIEVGNLRPLIGDTYSFEDAPDAIRFMESTGRMGKIVVRM